MDVNVAANAVYKFSFKMIIANAAQRDALDNFDKGR